VISRVQQDAERLGQEHQQLIEDLETEREQRLATQQQAERLEEEGRRLQQEHQRLEEELEQECRKRTPDRAESMSSHPWWRRPLLVVGLLLGVLIAWFTSLAVALNMLAS
jgi:Flp pilus assembly protein TadB